MFNIFVRQPLLQNIDMKRKRSIGYNFVNVDNMRMTCRFCGNVSEKLPGKQQDGTKGGNISNIEVSLLWLDGDWLHSDGYVKSANS